MFDETTPSLNQTNPVVFEAFVANLGKYNESELVGEWVKFPTTTENMKEVFDRIGIDGIFYEEYFITDYECSEYSDIYDVLGEYENLDELNYMAQCIVESGIDGSTLNGMVCIEHPSSAKDIINIVQNQDCFSIMSDIQNESDLGYHLAEEMGLFPVNPKENHLANQAAVTV